MTWLRRIWEYAVCFLFPERCIFCNEVIEPLRLCCDRCRGELATVTPPLCRYCGRSKTDCDCHRRHHPYDGVAVPFYYKDAAQKGILRLKRYDDPKAFTFFATQMAAVIRREYPDEVFGGVCYVPMTAADKRRREYNQSALLAAEVAKRLELPLLPILKKRYETKPQKGLDRAHRSGNLLGVFDVTDAVNGQTLLLVDDVLTTGATLSECAKMLKLAGADRVIATAIAVSAPKEKTQENR